MIKLGRFSIFRLQEMTTQAPASIYDGWSQDAPARDAKALSQSFYDSGSQTFTITIQNWIVTDGTTTLVIDTCVGNDKERAAPHLNQLQTDYLSRFKATGIDPGSVNMVINTHIHTDHVGWNTRLVDGAWKPTFPNATYVLSETEFKARAPEHGGAGKPAAALMPFMDSVQPIKDAGLLRLVDGEEELLPGIRLAKIPGHAPGQIGVRLLSEGKEAFFIADVLHQPIQVYHPEWTTRYCEDPATALTTRRAVLEHCAANGSLVFAGHFGPPYAGYVSRAGDGFAFEPSADNF